jgi:hypothetical protein
MTDLPSGPSVDPRLRDYLVAELNRAERDFPFVPRPGARPTGRRRPAGIAVAVLAVVVAVVIGPRLLPATSVGPGAIQIGTDGLPVSIDGEPVLRGDEITARIASSGPFLAGGTLELGSDPCPDTAMPSAAPCVEQWKLADASGAGPQFALDGMTAAPGFVRTSGALTVVRVASSGQRLCTTCEGTLTVEAVAWRKPTKGPIPDNASPPQGGPIYPALVPDFIPALARDGTTIAGYVPKARLIESGGVIPGTPSNPPQEPPEPVYAEDLTTLVGHMVPGVGFVPLGSSVPSSGASESVAPASVAPSASAAPSPSAYDQTFGPDYPPQPPAGQRTRVDDASISADGRTLTLVFTGGSAYPPHDFCSTDYVPWVAAAGADLEVAVVLVPHADQATAPPDTGCGDIGYGYTFHLRLPAPFTGSTIRDLTGGTLWVRPPPGLVEPQALPSGWHLAYSGDEPAAEPPLWVRVYAPAGSQVAGSNGGRGQLDLYQAFGSATRIGGGSERSTVQFGGSKGVLLRDAASGELLLQWMVGSDGVALVANEADMTLDQLLAIAAAVKPPGG